MRAPHLYFDSMRCSVTTPRRANRWLRLLLGVCVSAVLWSSGFALAADVSLDTVTVQLKWKHQFQFAGYYAALEKGFYREDGLNVRLVEGSPDRSPVEMLLAGRAEYAIADSGVLLERAKGKPVVVLATIFQHSPSILLTRSDTGILELADLQGKRIMLQNPPLNAELRAMLDGAGVRYIQQASSFDVEDLISGRTDAFNAYSTNEPFLMQQRGVPFRIFRPMDYGIDLYGDTLITTETELKEHPDRAAAFRRATIKGWEYALGHTDEIVDLIRRKYNTQQKSLAYLMYEAEAARELMPDIVPVGFFNLGRWRNVADIFVREGAKIDSVDWDRFLYQPKPDYVFFFRRYAWELSAGAIGLLLLVLVTYSAQLRRQVRWRTRALAQATQEAQFEREQLRAVITHAMDGIIHIDAQGAIQLFNPAAEQIFGYERREIIGKNVNLLMPEPFHSQHDGYLKRYLDTGEAHIIGTSGREVSGRRKDGSLFPLELAVSEMAAGDQKRFIGIVRDITERRQAEENIRHLAHFDSLTGLPNRNMFMDRVRQALAQAHRNKSGFSLLFIDLDGFKAVNDTLGHEAGDQVLKLVAGHLLECVREVDTVARLGGDEFTVILSGVARREQAVVVAEKIIAELDKPIVIEGKEHQIHIGSSIGIAMHPGDGEDADALISRADKAMYAAKQAGKNRYLFAQENGTSSETPARAP